MKLSHGENSHNFHVPTYLINCLAGYKLMCLHSKIIKLQVFWPHRKLPTLKPILSQLNTTDTVKTDFYE